LFFTEIFLICCNRSAYTTSNLDRPNLAADCPTLHCCLSSADGTHIARHYMSTGRDPDSYTVRFTARPWHEIDFLHVLHFLHFADNSETLQMVRMWLCVETKESLWQTERGLC
jgi:hypothetical protein